MFFVLISVRDNDGRENLANISRIMMLSIAIIVLLLLELCEQSVSHGHNIEELADLIRSFNYIPPGLSGILCGLINFILIFYCKEYQTLSSEWLLNIFYCTSEFDISATYINGHVCCEQISSILAMALGARISIWTSSTPDIPKLDLLFYSLVGLGSFLSALSLCLTTATFTDHLNLIFGFVGNAPNKIISMSLGAAWCLIYSSKFLGISTLK